MSLRTVRGNMPVKCEVRSFECIGLRQESAIYTQTDRHTDTHKSKSIISASGYKKWQLLRLAACLVRSISLFITEPIDPVTAIGSTLRYYMLLRNGGCPA